MRRSFFGRRSPDPQGGRAIISGLCINLVQDDHRSEASQRCVCSGPEEVEPAHHQDNDQEPAEKRVHASVSATGWPTRRGTCSTDRPKAPALRQTMPIGIRMSITSAMGFPLLCARHPHFNGFEPDCYSSLSAAQIAKRSSKPVGNALFATAMMRVGTVT